MPKPRPLRPFTIATNAQGKRNASPGPPSPTFSETTNVSAVNLGEHGPAKIITRSDLKASMQSYENVSALPLLSPSFEVRGKKAHTSPLSFHSLQTRIHRHVLALEFMFQLPICAAHNVPSYRRVCRRYGILCRVRSVAPNQLIYLSRIAKADRRPPPTPFPSL